jgi:hypothetical protein
MFDVELWVVCVSMKLLSCVVFCCLPYGCMKISSGKKGGEDECQGMRKKIESFNLDCVYDNMPCYMAWLQT